MNLIKLTLEYDGTAYAWWQRQPDQPTIQSVLETVLAQITQTSLSTVDDNTLNDAKFNYHKSMIELTKESLEDSPIYELRELSALTFAVDSEKLPEIIKKMKSLIREVNKVSSKGKYKDKVYQLNLSLFSLST